MKKEFLHMLDDAKQQSGQFTVAVKDPCEEVEHETV